MFQFYLIFCLLCNSSTFESLYYLCLQIFVQDGYTFVSFLFVISFCSSRQVFMVVFCVQSLCLSFCLSTCCFLSYFGSLLSGVPRIEFNFLCLVILDLFPQSFPLVPLDSIYLLSVSPRPQSHPPSRQCVSLSHVFQRLCLRKSSALKLNLDPRPACYTANL